MKTSTIILWIIAVGAFVSVVIIDVQISRLEDRFEKYLTYSGVYQMPEIVPQSGKTISIKRMESSGNEVIYIFPDPELYCKLNCDLKTNYNEYAKGYSDCFKQIKCQKQNH